MEKNTGKVREKSGNFVSPEKWEPCVIKGLYRIVWSVHTPQRQRLRQISIGFCTHFIGISIGHGLGVGQSE